MPDDHNLKELLRLCLPVVVDYRQQAKLKELAMGLEDDELIEALTVLIGRIRASVEDSNPQNGGRHESY